MLNEIKLNDKIFRIYNHENANVKFPQDSEKRGKKRSYYTEDFCTFDIETTSCILKKDEKGRFLEGFGYMYIWQFYSRTTGLVMGRYWDEFIDLLKRIGTAMHRKPSDPFVVCYVHNLPFEFSFMNDQLHAAGISYSVFAIKNRKVVSCRLDIGIEFRCSLKLINRGLAKYLKDMPAGYEKMVGDLNYRVQRTPKTEMTEQEIGYCAVDVIGLYYSLQRDFATTGDTVASVPLTVTGYVRRELKNAVKKDKSYSYLLSRSALTVKQYRMVRALAKGGDTLASASQILGVVHKETGSFDYKSHYPAQLECELYPTGKLEYEGRGIDIDIEVLDRIKAEGRYFITEFVAFDLELKNKCQPIPCITLSTTYFCDNGLYYNGRVLKAERLGIAMDMISFQLFLEQYKFSSIQFGYTYSCDYKPLPKLVRDVVHHYFELKCKLDDKRQHYPKGSPERESIEIDYALAKSRLNSLFGLFYTNPLHSVNDFDDEECQWQDEIQPVLTLDEAKIAYAFAKLQKTEEELMEIVEKNKFDLYKNQCTGAGLYLWGIHTASLGRFWLDRLIQAAGVFNVIYSDTDSVKIKYRKEALEGIARLNEKLKKRAIDHGAYVDTGEHVYYLGVAEDETADERYSEFVTLGAKKYAYRDSKGLHITISGVQKSCVDQLHDNIKEFVKGKVFDPAGGIMLHYVDHEMRMVHVVGDDGTEDDILLGNSICCEDRIITLGGIVDERFGEDFSIYKEIFEYLPDDD